MLHEYLTGKVVHKPSWREVKMLSPVIEETKTAGLKRILDIKGYNATVRFFRDIYEVARFCPSKYGSLHIDLQALLPQRGSDVILARYASLPVPPVPPCARPLRRCRAFDANLYELAIKNVTPAVMERLPVSYMSASSPASEVQ